MAFTRGAGPIISIGAGLAVTGAGIIWAEQVGPFFLYGGLGLVVLGVGLWIVGRLAARSRRADPLPPVVDLKGAELKTEGSNSPILIAAAGATIYYGNTPAPNVTTPSTSRIPDGTSAEGPAIEPWEVTITALDDPNTVKAEERAAGAEWCHFRVANVSLMELTSCTARGFIDGIRHDLIWANPDQGPPLRIATLPSHEQTDVPLVMRGFVGLGYCPTLALNLRRCYVSGVQLMTHCSTQDTGIEPGPHSLAIEVTYHVMGRAKTKKVTGWQLYVPTDRQTGSIRITPDAG